MDEITRRRFIETASLAAAAALARGGRAERGPGAGANPRAPRRVPPRGRAISRTPSSRRCSAAAPTPASGAPNDELGTLNYITPAKRIAAAALVKTGEVVSVARDLTTRQSKTNAQPVVHMMTFIDAEQPELRRLLLHRATRDGRDAHGRAVSLLLEGSVLQRAQALGDADGERRQMGIDLRAAAGHLHARRAARRRRRARRAWYKPDEYVTVADFEAAEKRQRVRVGSGDAMFVRTGMERMEAEQGEQDIYPRAGLHAECAEWMHNRQVSVYGGDCIEKLPYPSESFTSAMHMIVLASMGLPILDWPSLTELARRASA